MMYPSWPSLQNQQSALLAMGTHSVMSLHVVKSQSSNPNVIFTRIFKMKRRYLLVTPLIPFWYIQLLRVTPVDVY